MIKLIISDESAAFLLFFILPLAFQRSRVSLFFSLLYRHACKYHFCQQFKYPIDISVVLCTCFQELYAVLFSESKSLLV